MKLDVHFKERHIANKIRCQLVKTFWLQVCSCTTDLCNDNDYEVTPRDRKPIKSKRIDAAGGTTSSGRGRSESKIFNLTLLEVAGLGGEEDLSEEEKRLAHIPQHRQPRQTNRRQQGIILLKTKQSIKPTSNFNFEAKILQLINQKSKIAFQTKRMTRKITRLLRQSLPCN